jgi:hypothetical protein
MLMIDCWQAVSEVGPERPKNRKLKIERERFQGGAEGPEEGMRDRKSIKTAHKWSKM